MCRCNISQVLAILLLTLSLVSRSTDSTALPPQTDIQPISDPKSPLSLNAISRDLWYFLGLAIAPTTCRTYAAGIKRFLQFCSATGLSPPPPIPSHTLQLFAAYLANTVSYKTIKVYLAGLRHWHILKGLPEPTPDPLLEYTVRGIRRQQGENPRRRLPITTATLKYLKSQLRQLTLNHADKRMLWAAFCVAFYGFLRVSEFTCQAVGSFNPDQSLLRQDIILQGSAVTIEIKASKTDPFR